MCLGSAFLLPSRAARSRHPVVRVQSGITELLLPLVDTWIGTSHIVAACRVATRRLLCTSLPSCRALQLISSRLVTAGSSVDILESDEQAATLWLSQITSLPISTGIRQYDPPWYMDTAQLEASGVCRKIRWFRVESANGYPPLTVYCCDAQDPVYVYGTSHPAEHVCGCQAFGPQLGLGLYDRLLDWPKGAANVIEGRGSRMSCLLQWLRPTGRLLLAAVPGSVAAGTVPTKCPCAEHLTWCLQVLLKRMCTECNVHLIGLGGLDTDVAPCEAYMIQKLHPVRPGARAPACPCCY